jgi:hypothetical protein
VINLVRRGCTFPLYSVLCEEKGPLSNRSFGSALAYSTPIRQLPYRPALLEKLEVLGGRRADPRVIQNPKLPPLESYPFLVCQLLRSFQPAPGGHPLVLFLAALGVLLLEKAERDLLCDPLVFFLLAVHSRHRPHSLSPTLFWLRDLGLPMTDR